METVSHMLEFEMSPTGTTIVKKNGLHIGELSLAEGLQLAHGIIAWHVAAHAQIAQAMAAPAPGTIIQPG